MVFSRLGMHHKAACSRNRSISIGTANLLEQQSQTRYSPLRCKWYLMSRPNIPLAFQKVLRFETERITNAVTNAPKGASANNSPVTIQGLNLTLLGSQHLPHLLSFPP